MPVIPNGNAQPGGGYAGGLARARDRLRVPGVGLPIVEELTLSGVPAVVIDDDPAPALARMIAAWDVPLITGQARAEETLISPGLAGAIAVICAQENDLSALETALLVRRLRAEVRVIASWPTLPSAGRSARQAWRSSMWRACPPRRWSRSAWARASRSCRCRECGSWPPAPPRRTRRRCASCTGRSPRWRWSRRPATCSSARAGTRRVRAGDEVTLIGTPDELAAASVIDHPERIRRLAATASPGGNGTAATAGPPGILGVLGGEDPDALPAGPSPAGRALRWLRDLAVSLARAADRRMAIALGALLAVLVTATLVLHFTYRLRRPRPPDLAARVGRTSPSRR